MKLNKTLKKSAVCLLAVAAVLLSAFISSCGSSDADNYGNGTADMNMQHRNDSKSYVDLSSSARLEYGGDDMFAEEESMDMEMPAMEMPAEPMAGFEGGEVSTAARSDRKIVYSAWANLQTKEYDRAIAALKELCDEYDAYFESSNSYGNRLDYATERRSKYVIRVPVENYPAFVGKVGNIGSVVESGEDNKDVTERYVDTEARLESAKIREERVLVLLENSGSLDDVLALERELADIRYEIESMTGSLRKLDSLISYATYRLTIEEVVEYTAPVTVPKTFGERMTQNFKDGWRDFVSFWQNVAVGLSYGVFAIVTWLVFIVIIVVIIVAAVKVSRKNQKKRLQKIMENSSAINNVQKSQNPQTPQTSGEDDKK